MLETLEKIKQTETQAQLQLEEARQTAQQMIDDAEHQGKGMLIHRRKEAHQKATALIADAQAGQREILMESDRHAQEEFARIEAIGEKNMAAAVALIATRIVVTS